MSDVSPSTLLRRQNEENWDAAVRHPFCAAFAQGKVPRENLIRYLAQDYTFIDNFFRLASSAIHHAPTLADRLPLAHFLGVLAGPENTYFQRSFDALAVDQHLRSNPELEPATKEFQDLMLVAAKSGEYGQMVAVLAVAEWTYLDWATHYASQSAVALDFVYREWITLHTGDYFESVVSHLRSQLDKAWNDAKGDDDARENIAKAFAEAVRLERAFFDMAWQDA